MDTDNNHPNHDSGADAPADPTTDATATAVPPCPVTEGQAVERMCVIIRERDRELADAIEASNHHRRMMILMMYCAYVGIVVGWFIAGMIRRHREDAAFVQQFGHVDGYPVEE